MLYLIPFNQTPYTPLYSTFISSINRGVWATPYDADKYYTTCIIDIDEYEACVLALKGVPIFRVATLTPRTTNIMHECRYTVEMVDMSTLMYWWGTLWEDE